KLAGVGKGPKGRQPDEEVGEGVNHHRLDDDFTQGWPTPSHAASLWHSSTAERPSSAAAAAPVRYEPPETDTAAAVCCSVWILIMASLQRVHWRYQQPVTPFRGDHDKILHPTAPILLRRRSPCQNPVPLHPRRNRNHRPTTNHRRLLLRE